MIVLDTNILSELIRKSPAPSVVAWLKGLEPAIAFTTTVTEAEMLYGVRILPVGERRATLERALMSMFAEDFERRVLPFDGAAADRYADIASLRRAAGRPISQFDAQIAAIALSRGATLATRNVADFDMTGLNVVNPFG